MILAKIQALYKKLLSWCELFWKKGKDLAVGRPVCLEKVEELTLYILQQQAQIDELKRILAEQQ